MELAQVAATALANPKAPHRLFREYFGTTTPYWVEKVHKVFASISSQTSPGSGSEMARAIYFRKEDFGKGCKDEGTAAYALPDEKNTKESNVHICPVGYKKKELHFFRTPCVDFGDRTSDRMDTTARLILHEFLHHIPVALSACLDPITDIEFPDDDGKATPAYGPFLVRQLAKREGQGINKAIRNADSFAWFAQVSISTQEPAP